MANLSVVSTPDVSVRMEAGPECRSQSDKCRRQTVSAVAGRASCLIAVNRADHSLKPKNQTLTTAPSPYCGYAHSDHSASGRDRWMTLHLILRGCRIALPVS